MLTPLVNTILAINVPNLNTRLYGDVYDILNNREINYVALVVEAVRSEKREEYDYITLRLTIVDKLLDDESNLLNIFDGCEMLLNDLLKKTPETIDYEDYTIDYIKQDFADHLAGIYADITFIMPSYDCEYYDKEYFQ